MDGGKSMLPDYKQAHEKAKDFLSLYRPAAGPHKGIVKYDLMLEAIARRESKLVEVELDDVLEYAGDMEFVANIVSNSFRYMEVFSGAIDELLKESHAVDDAIRSEEVFDVLQSHRMQQLGVGDGAEGDPAAGLALPSRLMRRYEVRFVPLSSAKPVPLREIRATHIGHLVTVRAIATRASDVKPLVTVATYTCDACGFETYQNVNARSFMPLKECPSDVCRQNQTVGRLHMQTRGSKFIKFQEIKVQELPDQVPVGHIPRSMTVIARGELTRQILPGDNVVIDGVFLPTPYTGFKAMRAGLIADTYLEAHRVLKSKKTYADTTLTPEMEAKVDELASEREVYSMLARSIAPEIFGHDDVKKALLLQLVGGVSLARADGMKIRGDINILLMGDPGVAKSQLLKQIAHIAPRGVYTTGKGSSGVGLTAAVIKDPVTGEMMLEGGALVLADMGICCIDEFDKMDDADRTAIHEVMEQQTVSIAKAGITTTLNARTSVLAAANPLYGRYNPKAAADPHTALLRNVNLPAALLSRFDLLFLILDKPDDDDDRSLAQHVTHVHQKGCHPPLEFEAVSPKLMRSYVSMARSHNPFVPQALTQHIVESYVTLRQEDAKRAAEGRTILTARQLLSILRMSQALARIQFMDEVTEDHVDEAMRLVTMSKSSILSSKETGPELDPVSRIFGIIKDTLTSRETTSIAMADVEQIVTRSGFSREQLQQCIKQYSDLLVWSVNPSSSKLFLTNP